MPRSSSFVPKYRMHRATGQAVVTIEGRDFYLGPHRSKASLVEYDRLIAEWLAGGRALPLESPGELAMSELILRYWKFARQYYVKNGKPTRMQEHVRLAMKLVRKTYGHTTAGEFGPLALKAVRLKLVETGGSRGYPHVFIATIHDSIMATPEHAETVRGVMLEEFEKLGVCPRLKIEDYGAADVACGCAR